MQDYLRVTTATYTEKSNVSYLRVMNAVADNKGTMIQVLSDLQEQFISNGIHEYIILEGDAKLYEVLQSLKFECGECFKVTGDSLHLEIFTSNKLFVSPQGKQLWSWNKNEIIANMMIETAVTILKQPSHRKSQAMAAIITNSSVKFYQDKGV